VIVSQVAARHQHSESSDGATFPLRHGDGVSMAGPLDDAPGLNGKPGGVGHRGEPVQRGVAGEAFDGGALFPPRAVEAPTVRGSLGVGGDIPGAAAGGQ
jgi:hypothetical protein